MPKYVILGKLVQLNLLWSFLFPSAPQIQNNKPDKDQYNYHCKYTRYDGVSRVFLVLYIRSLKVRGRL